MKYFSFLIFLSLLLLTGCSTNYYLVSSETETPIYSTETNQAIIASIPTCRQFVIYGTKVKRHTYFGIHKGYTLYNSSWNTLAKLNKKQTQSLVFNSEQGYVFKPASTSSHSGSKSTSNGGTVHVKGYTRKDGTYVRPHTRSAPTRH